MLLYLVTHVCFLSFLWIARTVPCFLFLFRIYYLLSVEQKVFGVWTFFSNILLINCINTIQCIFMSLNCSACVGHFYYELVQNSAHKRFVPTFTVCTRNMINSDYSLAVYVLFLMIEVIDICCCSDVNFEFQESWWLTYTFHM